MTVAGNYVPEEVAANLISLIASTPELHSYSVQKLYIALTSDAHQVISSLHIFTNFE
jgi:AP-1 complex subunit gamma-1